MQSRGPPGDDTTIGSPSKMGMSSKQEYKTPKKGGLKESSMFNIGSPNNYEDENALKLSQL
jgi:hypothetical protein